MTWMRSPLKYPGGKYQLLNRIDELFPRGHIDTYVEPFLGGGSVALNLGCRCDRMILNDINSDLINFWEMVIAVPSEVFGYIAELSEQISLDDYKRLRADFNSRSCSEPFHAALFYYLNRVCFNGLVRYNHKGHFNVPYGKIRSFKMPDLSEFRSIARRLASNTRFAEDGVETFLDKVLSSRHLGNTFIFLDPPYIPTTRTANFTGYWRPYQLEEHQSLRTTLDKLTERGIQWMLTNSATKATEEIYKGYNFHTSEALRSISRQGNSRGKVQEYIITNY